MQGIEFEDDRSLSSFNTKTQIPRPEGKPSMLLRLLMKMGINDKSTANLILLGVAFIFFGITFFVYAGILGESAPSPQNVQQIAEQMRALREMQK